MDTFMLALLLLIASAVVSSAVLWYLTKENTKRETTDS